MEAPFRDAARRIMARCDELARYSSMEGGIERVYLSPEHARVNRLASRWMREVGLDTWQDEAGNLNGHLAGRDPEAPSLLLGSHLDSVRDAGRYDGILGVLMAIEVVRHLMPQAPSLRFGLDVVAFWDEEGARFGTALLGSSAMAGQWDDAWWDLTDEHGTTLKTAFREFGLDPGRVGAAARRPETLAGYLEAHIEQGPDLDRSNRPLGVVTSIASARRFSVQIVGEARHAGGTRYEDRHDALLGASEATLAVERLCRAEHHIVGTVGRLETFPGAVNVVPGEARLTVDLRGEHDDDRDRVWADISRRDRPDRGSTRTDVERPADPRGARRLVRRPPAGRRARRHRGPRRRARPRPCSAAPATTPWPSGPSPASACSSCATPTASAITPTSPSASRTSRRACGP